ncbi:anti-sigma factor [Pseudomonas leptonychotis]|jgi:predicted anti-sigma-YlaC factor YlaD|uniref:Zf-HC2 domain-containing protein n=1 Tax=Pseudomonas leptonychotis TaxID=2448482 RepID=A0A4T1ZSX9_9PSED|nr:zf-HC2 domain-containing protein [Pseudomonas leptonychotis]TIH07117.1 zf-HC2 domain-containing protein [Pseudomonas leptonychotis]
MLSCKELVAHSSEYIDGQMKLRRRLSVRMHLAMCVNCRRFIKQLRLSQAVLRRLPRGQSAELDELAAKLAEVHRQQH